MKRPFYFLSFFLFGIALLGSTSISAQPIFNMSNMTVDDCKGILLDSELGDPPMTYDHNENYTFSICIPGASEIELEFESFCTEPPFNGTYFDYMRFYDGPDTLSPQIGGIFADTLLPTGIIATSGCLTVNFISDANVTCAGWRAKWEVVVPEPIPLNIFPISDIECDENMLSIRFDRDVPCTAIVPSAFVINGPLGVTVATATPVNCSGGTTRDVNLSVNPPFSVSGDYSIVFTMEETDICQEVHILTAVAGFRVVNCPLFVSIIIADDPICAGTCTFLTARATGGFVGTYTYQWDPSAPSARRIEVCPDFPTTYSVTVTDEQGGTAEASILLTPLPAPVIIGGNQVLCQSDDPFTLMATIPGGTWSALGISEGATESGYYDPGLVTIPEDTIRYIDGNGCEALVIFTVAALEEGTDDAACPGSAPFQVSGGLPIGGVWSGPNISPDGLFTPPSTPGNFEVTYTHPNGCTGTKTIAVGDIQFPLTLDTLCQSDSAFLIPITPFGGTWSGPGIVDEDTGAFDPSEADAGDNLVHYVINGCQDSMVLFIKAIDARFDFSACPSQTPFILPGNWGPAGGIWSGLGVTDTLAGLYDPAILGDGNNDTLQYAFDGCVDERIVYIRTTDLDVLNTLEFCTDAEDFTLDPESVGTVPRDGDWSGPGSILIDDIWYFRAALAGPGLHTLVYTANTCLDSMQVEVFEAPQITPGTFCEREAVQTLQSNQSGGLWSGEGITDENLGLFDPGIAGPGTHTIYYESVDGCTVEMEVIVTPFEMAELINLGASYCFRDTQIIIQTAPAGGVLSIDGQVASSFNPMTLGLGDHTVTYTVGTGDCQDQISQVIQIGEPLSIQLPFDLDSICFGFNIQLSAMGSGGESQGGYTYFWDQGLGFGKDQLVTPTTTTTYTVSMEDGCSEPATASVTVIVHPEIEVQYITGPRVCHLDTSSATIISPAEGAFSFVWDSSPPTLGPAISSRPSTYTVTISNDLTGCEVEEEIQIPGYPAITANFGTSPNGECVSSLEPHIDVLDFSVGGTKGTWDFGDSTFTERYVLGDPISHSYENPGEYLITLSLENAGGCTSVHQESVCVREEHRLFAPTAITPNYDGLNDYFQFKGLGIATIEWQVINRFGQVIFEGSGMDDRWDAVYKGVRVRGAVYNYIARYTTIYDSEILTSQGFITVVY